MLFFDKTLHYIKDFISVIGVIVIVMGTLHSLYQIIQLIKHKKFSINAIRLQFGHTVILGLEFMVAGDIVGSLIEPDYYNLGLLGILVIIRTILSYFLNLELEALSPEQRKEI
jgi:uncharacterized membrane protein